MYIEISVTITDMATRVHTARVIDFDDENDDIRGVVGRLGLPALEVGTLYHMMGIETDYNHWFNDQSISHPEQTTRSRVLRWSWFLINGKTRLNLEEWQKGWNGITTDLEQNVETPALARQTFRATYGLSFFPNPTDERQLMAVLALIVLAGAGLTFLVYYRRKR